MSNIYDKKIMQDGWRNAIIKLTGILDSGNASLTPAVQLSDFRNNDTANQAFIGFRVDHLWHSIGDGMELQLTWASVGGTDEPLFAIAGRGRESFEMDGGIRPKQDNVGFTGNINLFTTGWGVAGSQAIQNYTIELVMIKLYKN